MSEFLVGAECLSDDISNQPRTESLGGTPPTY